MDQIKRIVRPTDVPDSGTLCSLITGLICDLLWSDPEYDVLSWEESERGVSYVFGAEIVKEFLKQHNLDLICRAHQVRQICLIAGGRGWVRVFREEVAGDAVLGAELLRRVRQCGRDDEYRRIVNVFFSSAQAGGPGAGT